MFCKFKKKEITGVFPGKGYLQRLSPIFSQILNTAEAKKKSNHVEKTHGYRNLPKLTLIKVGEILIAC